MFISVWALVLMVEPNSLMSKFMQNDIKAYTAQVIEIAKGQILWTCTVPNVSIAPIVFIEQTVIINFDELTTTSTSIYPIT